MPKASQISSLTSKVYGPYYDHVLFKHTYPTDGVTLAVTDLQMYCNDCEIGYVLFQLRLTAFARTWIDLTHLNSLATLRKGLSELETKKLFFSSSTKYPLLIASLSKLWSTFNAICVSMTRRSMWDGAG